MKISHFRRKGKCLIKMKLHFEMFDFFILLFPDRTAVRIHNCDRQWNAMTWLDLIPCVMS